MKLLKSILPFVFFAILSFIVVFPLLAPGYILTLDAVSAPIIHLAPFASSGFLLSLIFKALEFFMPSYQVQKVFLLVILFLSGISLFYFIPKRYPLARWFGGLFYIFNPFVYERAVAGQYGILLAYAVFPLIMGLFIKSLTDPGLKNAVFLALLTTVIITASLHFALWEIFCFLIIFLVHFFLERKSLVFNRNFYLLFLSLTLILNLNLLLGLFWKNGSVFTEIASFNRGDLIAFQSVSDPHFGLLPNLLSGYGFWIEATNYFLNQKDLVIIWPLLSLIILTLAAYGLWKFLNEERKNSALVLSLLLLFFTALSFAAGIAEKNFKDFFFFLYEKVPLLIGFREPQKLVSMVILFLAFFGGLGLEYLVRGARRFGKLIFCVGLILPIIYSPALLGGFWGQVKPVFYPSSWQKVNEILNRDQDGFNTLVFPWHQYLRLNFANDLVVANPAPVFFAKPILSSQNYETVSLSSHDQRPEALHIEGLLSMQKYHLNLFGETVSPPKKFGEAIAPINVKYVILTKNDDWKTYNFLDKSPDLMKIYDAPEISLYENEAWTPLE